MYLDILWKFFWMFQCCAPPLQHINYQKKILQSHFEEAVDHCQNSFKG